MIGFRAFPFFLLFAIILVVHPKSREDKKPAKERTSMSGKSKFFYQGHASLRFTTAEGQVIYVDPYVGEGYDKPADFLLVTHQHYDHNVVGKVTQKPDCFVVTNEEALEGGVHQTFERNGVKITAVRAENKNHDPKKCVGSLLEFDGLKIYCAGDTSMTEDMAKMKAMNLDYALLPVDGIYNMDAEEASRCAELIGAKTTIPIHTNPEGFKIEVAKRLRCDSRRIVHPGEEIDL